MKVSTTVEWDEEEKRALQCLDYIARALHAANGAGDSFPDFAHQGLSSEPPDENEGVYGWLNRGFNRALEVFAGSVGLVADERATPNAIMNLVVADRISDRVLDNGESVTWNVTQMVELGELR